MQRCDGAKFNNVSLGETVRERVGQHALRLTSSLFSTSRWRFREDLSCFCLSVSYSGKSIGLSGIASIFAISFLTFSFSLSDVSGPGLSLLLPELFARDGSSGSAFSACFVGAR